MTRPAEFPVVSYQERVYGPLPCWDLVATVYAEHLGEAPDVYKTITHNVRAAARRFLLELHKGAHGFSQVEEPDDYAIVLMWKSPRHAQIGLCHCGIYWQGSVLHANETGTFFEALSGLSDVYPIMEFWAR